MNRGLWRIREKELLAAREAHFVAGDESGLLIKRAAFVRSMKQETVDPLILRPSDDLFDEEAGDSVSSPLRFGENIHNYRLPAFANCRRVDRTIVSGLLAGVASQPM